MHQTPWQTQIIVGRNTPPPPRKKCFGSAHVGFSALCRRRPKTCDFYNYSRVGIRQCYDLHLNHNKIDVLTCFYVLRLLIHVLTCSDYLYT